MLLGLGTPQCCTNCLNLSEKLPLSQPWKQGLPVAKKLNLMLQKKAYQNIKLHLHVAVKQVSARLKKMLKSMKKIRLMIKILDQLYTAWICSCSLLLTPSCPNILTSFKKRSSLTQNVSRLCYSEQNSFAGRDCGFAATFKLSLNWKAVKSLCLQIVHLIVPQIWQKFTKMSRMSSPNRRHKYGNRHQTWWNRQMVWLQLDEWPCQSFLSHLLWHIPLVCLPGCPQLHLVHVLQEVNHL